MSDETKENQPLQQHEQKQRSLIVSICQLLLEGGILSVASFLTTLPILDIVIFAGQLSIFNLAVISLVIAGFMFIGSTMRFGTLFSVQPQISVYLVLASGDIARVPAVFQRGVFAISPLYFSIALPILFLSPFIFLALQQNQQVAFAAGYLSNGKHSKSICISFTRNVSANIYCPIARSVSYCVNFHNVYNWSSIQLYFSCMVKIGISRNNN